MGDISFRSLEDVGGGGVCQCVHFKAVLGRDIDHSIGAESMRPTPDTGGGFRASVANNLGGREVCGGTDQAVFEESTACSGGTRVLGDSSPGLGVHEGMQGHADTCAGIEAARTSLHLLVQEAWRRPQGQDGALGHAELRPANPFP